MPRKQYRTAGSPGDRLHRLLLKAEAPGVGSLWGGDYPLGNCQHPRLLMGGGENLPNSA